MTSGSQSSSSSLTQLLAHELATAASRVGRSTTSFSPFAAEAVKHGLGLSGGKLDDVSVIVGRVTKQEIAKSPRRVILPSTASTSIQFVGWESLSSFMFDSDSAFESGIKTSSESQ